MVFMGSYPMIASLSTAESARTERRSLRVAVVEDDPTLRLFLEKLLQKKDLGFVPSGSFPSAEAAVVLLKEKPDVVVVDLELPGVSGMEMIRHLAPHMPFTAFVVLTIHDDPEKVFAALRAGAHGYLLKSARPSDIAAGIRQASEGGAPLSQDIARLLIQSFKQPVKQERKEIPGLTPRESQILERLAKGMAPKEVAHDLSLSYETVRDYLKAVYQKLHVRSRTEAVLKYLEATK
jgi:DNA-binding NarL/FixJ family response regulator